MLRVTEVDIHKVVVPCRPNVVSSPEYPDEVLDGFDRIPKYIIRLHTADGPVGAGETTRGAPRSDVEACARAIVGLDLDRVPLMQLPCPRNSAYDAFEMAIFDALGRAREMPAWALLGGRWHERVPVDWWMGLCTVDETGRRIERGLTAGFHGVKIKCKLEQEPAARVARIKELAPHWTVTLDPNERFYRPAGALELARELSGYSGLLFESPVPQRRLDWYQRLRRECPIPLALHLGGVESLVPALEMGCADVYNLNGSMTEFVTATRAAAAAGCPVWHGSGVDLGLRDASFVHACAATPAELWPSDIIGNFLREDDLITEPLRLEQGAAVVSDAPGLGVELDLEAVARYEVPEGG